MRKKRSENCNYDGGLPVLRQANAQVSHLLHTDNLDAATVVAYTDASVSGTTIHAALVVRLYQKLARNAHSFRILHHQLTLLSWPPYVMNGQRCYLFYNQADASSS
ncbi:hypothetical protein MRX96_002319 [Rhipicephalus microplus]